MDFVILDEFLCSEVRIIFRNNLLVFRSWYESLDNVIFIDDQRIQYLFELYLSEYFINLFIYHFLTFVFKVNLCIGKCL